MKWLRLVVTFIGTQHGRFTFCFTTTIHQTQSESKIEAKNCQIFHFFTVFFKFKGGVKECLASILRVQP